jgi:hypothetical protein
MVMTVLTLRRGSRAPRPVRQLPGQRDNEKSYGDKRGQDKSARRPRPERGHKRWDFVCQQITEIAVIRAEMEVERHDDANVNCADDVSAPQILPTRPEGQHRHVEDGVAKNDRVLGPEPPEQRQSRTRRERRLDKGLTGEGKGPKVERCAQPPIEREQRERGDHATEVANVQRQSDGRIKAVAVPPNIVTQPVRAARKCRAPNASPFRARAAGGRPRPTKRKCKP